MRRTLSRIGRMAILVCLGGLGAFALRAEWQPGLKVGKVAGSANWKDYPAETNTTLRLDATEKAENRGAYAFWAENVTYVYWGQMYFQEGVYHFGEYMDDSAWVEIDGKVVLKDTLWNQRTSSGDVPMTEGWHDVAFRFGNGSGGAGPVAGLNWTATKGFGYNCNGKDSTDGNDYELLFDTGDGAFFRHDDGTGFGNPILGKVSANVIDGARATVTAGLVSLGNGSDSAELTLYYGVADGGTDAAAWERAQALPTATAAGEQTATVTGLAAETTYFFRIYAKNARGEAWSAAKSFKSWGVPALASADCTGVAPTVAGFAWELGAGDFAWCGVELREKDGAAIETAAWELIPAGERQTQAVGNLTPGAAYEWNVVASNGQGVVRSEVKEFTTLTQVVSRRSVRSGSWGDAATWDPAGVPFIGDIVTVSAGTVVTNAAATESLASLTVEEGGELFVEGWDSAIRATGAVTVAGRLVHATNEVLTANAAGEWVPIARVWVVCGSFDLTATGVIDGRGRGYPGARKDDGKVDNTFGRGPGGGRYMGTGGTYGGTGGYFASSRGAITPERRSPTYGSASEPTQPGSGANKVNDADPFAGSGGGAVRIETTGDVCIDGVVDVDGTPGCGITNKVAPLFLMGGSGGSVWISCARILGSGIVRANGGEGESYGCGGGGGRIAVAYDPAAQAALDLPGVRFCAMGGFVSREGGLSLGWRNVRIPNCEAGGLGTLWFPDSQFLVRTLETGVFRHGGLWTAPGTPADLTVSGDLLVEEGALALSEANLTVTGDLVVRAGKKTFPIWNEELCQPASRLSLSNGTLTVGGALAATNVWVETHNGSLSVAGDVSFSRVRGVAGSDGTFRPEWRIGGAAHLSDKTVILVESAADGDRPTALEEIPASGGALFAVAGELALVKSDIWVASHPTNGGSPWFHVGSLSVDKNSSFDADQFGFDGYVWAKGDGRGPGAGRGLPVADATGGGYGGCGANAATVDGTFWGGTYGSAYAPYLPGSSGGSPEIYSPDAGGAIRILCDGVATVNGTLTASSINNNFHNWACGSSGGAVWVICRTFEGTEAKAALKASGSDGWNANYLAGGGGRIAVWLLPQSNASASAVRKMLAEGSGADYAIGQPVSWVGTTSAAAGKRVQDAPTYQRSDAEDGTVTWVSVPPAGGFLIRIR